MNLHTNVRWILLLLLGAMGAGAVSAQTTSSWQYTFTPCNGNYCPGWTQVDASDTGLIFVSTAGVAYKCFTSNGQIWRYRQGIWVLISTATDIVGCSVGGSAYRLHAAGVVEQWIDIHSAIGWGGYWRQIDSGPNVYSITAGAGANEVYEILEDNQVRRYTGSGWQEIDNNRSIFFLVAGNNEVYEYHQDNSIWRYIGTPCGNGACYGWEKLDDNEQTITIVADNYNNLYQLHENGQIFKYTGTPCSGNYCPGWQMLDDNPHTVLIAAAAGNLYQLHDISGQIWQYTGTPCSGATCTGWQMLDDNPATGFIAAGGNALFEQQ